MKALRTSVIAMLICTACASHHTAPQDRLTADLQDLQEAVKINVGDGQRATRLNRSIDELGAQLRSFAEAHRNFQSQFLTLNSRPDATRAEFDSLVSGFDKQRVAIGARVFQLHSEMIAATTAHEWNTLAYYERKALTDPQG